MDIIWQADALHDIARELLDLIGWSQWSVAGATDLNYQYAHEIIYAWASHQRGYLTRYIKSPFNGNGWGYKRRDSSPDDLRRLGNYYVGLGVSVYTISIVALLASLINTAAFWQARQLPVTAIPTEQMQAFDTVAGLERLLWVERTTRLLERWRKGPGQLSSTTTDVDPTSVAETVLTNGDLLLILLRKMDTSEILRVAWLSRSLRMSTCVALVTPLFVDCPIRPRVPTPQTKRECAKYVGTLVKVILAPTACDTVPDVTRRPQVGPERSRQSTPRPSFFPGQTALVRTEAPAPSRHVCK